MRNAPARVGTIENVRDNVVRGRPSVKDSSACKAAGNTCAAPLEASFSSGICAATAPSAIASICTVADSPARAACGKVT